MPYIDIVALNRKRQLLQEEIDNIDTILEMVAQYQQKEPPPAPQTPNRSERNHHQGLRKAIILALYTGPASEYDITRVCPKTTHSDGVKVALRTMTDEGLIGFEAATSHYFLTGAGKARAVWHINNPRYLVYAERRLAK